MRLPIGIVSVVLAAVAFFLGLYDWSQAMDNRTEQGRKSLWVSTQYGIFSSRSNFTNAGWRHRNRSIVCGVLFLSSTVVAWIIFH